MSSCYKCGRLRKKSLKRRRNFDPSGLLSFRKSRKSRRRRRNFDPSGLLALRRRNLDPSGLLAFRKRRNFDPSGLLAFRKNLEVERLLSFKCRCKCHKRKNLNSSRLLSARKKCSCKKNHRVACNRQNPDPNGDPWGPELYNPLMDKNNKFKNEDHYKNILAELYKRNPRGDNYVN